MKIIKIFLFIFFPLSLVSQNVDEIFKTKNEIYFSFAYQKKSEIDKYSKIISLLENSINLDSSELNIDSSSP